MRPEILNPLFAPVSSLEGIGPKLEKALSQFFHGTQTSEPARVIDLVFHAPASVIDRSYQPKIADAPDAAIVTLKVHVDRHQPPPRGNARVPYRVYVHDESAEMQLVFFRAHADYLLKNLPVCESRYVSVRIEWFNGRPNMVHPDHIVDATAFAGMPLIEPVYPGTAGIAQKTMARAIRQAVDRLPEFAEWADASVIKREGWPRFRDAIINLHSPRDSLDLDPNSVARRRL